MSKVKIKLVSVGHLPANFDKTKIEQWESALFKIQGQIESFTLNNDSDGPNWEFSDQNLLKELPNNFNGDFLLALVNVPLELNWYSRRLGENKVVFTFHEINEFLCFANIPLENIIYRVLYVYSLVYKRHGNRIPEDFEITNFTHDETRGCLFDMNGLKTDVIYSCHNPIICPDCVDRLSKEKISKETISTVQKEIKKIKKDLFYRIADFVKLHPVWALAISSFSAILLGSVGSILGTFIYELLTKK